MKKILFMLFMMVILTSCSINGRASINNEVNSDYTSINVSGTGIVNVEADMVSFNVRISEIAETTGEAQGQTNKKINQILSILKNYNVDDKDIKTQSLNFNTSYHWEGDLRVRDGEQVTQTLSINLRNIGDFGFLADDLGNNISGLTLSNVFFTTQDNSEALLKARELAYEDALSKAQTYVKKAGLTLSNPISITDGYSTSPTRSVYVEEAMMLSKSANDAGYSYGTEVPSGSLSVTVNTSVVFKAY